MTLSVRERPRIVERALQLPTVVHRAKAALRVGMAEGIEPGRRRLEFYGRSTGRQFQQRLGRFARQMIGQFEQRVFGSGLHVVQPFRRNAVHADWWQARIARQQEIDKSIAAKAEFEYLYDKPYDDKKKVRVAGPFTVESLSPHRVLGVDENDELIDGLKEDSAEYQAKLSFPQMILENLKTAGVQQAHKEDRIIFTALMPWPGDLVCGEGRYMEGGGEKRAAIFIGPEFGTVQRADLVAAAREAVDAAFDRGGPGNLDSRLSGVSA